MAVIESYELRKKRPHTGKSLWRKIIIKQVFVPHYKSVAICCDAEGNIYKVFTAVVGRTVIDLILKAGQSDTRDGITRTFTKEEADQYAPDLRKRWLT